MKSLIGTPRRAWLMGVLLLAITFSAGGLTGAATNRVLSADQPERRCEKAEGTRGASQADMLERLQLSAEQRTQVESILDRRREQMSAFWTEHRHQLRSIVDSTRIEVRAILTPAQLAEEERIWSEGRSYFKRTKKSAERQTR